MFLFPSTYGSAFSVFFPSDDPTTLPVAFCLWQEQRALEKSVRSAKKQILRVRLLRLLRIFPYCFFKVSNGIFHGAMIKGTGGVGVAAAFKIFPGEKVDIHNSL